MPPPCDGVRLANWLSRAFLAARGIYRVMSKVLLVEDDADLCELIAVNLRKEGLTVECSDNAYEASDHVSTGNFDVVVLDLMLRASSGMYVIDVVRRTAASRRPRVIVVTGATSEAIKSLDRSIVKAVMFKPLDMATFPSVVRIEADRVATLRPRG